MAKSEIRLNVLNESFVPHERKIELRSSIRKTAGQVAALERFLDENRPCAEFLTQTAAAQEALKRIARLMVRNYSQRCETAAIKAGRRVDMHDEFAGLIFKLVK